MQSDYDRDENHTPAATEEKFLLDRNDQLLNQGFVFLHDKKEFHLRTTKN